MRTLLLRLAVLALLVMPVGACGSGGAVEAPPAKPIAVVIVILTPNGGEEWTGGEAAEVTWKPGTWTGQVDIEYSLDGGATWEALAAGVENDGAETVTAPVLKSETVQVQVSAADGDPATLREPSDVSDAAFAIRLPFGLLSPNGGETWGVGIGYTVRWNPGRYTGNVDVEYSGDRGKTWVPLVVDTPNDGAQVVVMPDIVTVFGNTATRIQVSAADGDPSVPSAPADQSDASFTTIYPFRSIRADLTGVEVGGVAWGDYDGDGDLDLAVMGHVATVASMKIYRNDGGIFVDGPVPSAVQGPGAYSGDLAWGDYDNDGDLDLVVIGRMTFGGLVPRIYRNDEGAFSDIRAGLPYASIADVAWADVNADGQLDVVIAGSDPLTGGGVAQVCLNDGGAFTSGGAGLVPARFAALAAGDYDGDGDIDLALAGGLITGGFATRIYGNDGHGAFSDIAAGLAATYDGTVAWGDFDADGDLDLAAAGLDLAKIYRNDGNGTFVDIEAGLPNLSAAALAWGDMDGDGDLDLAIAGRDASGALTRIYSNDDGTFRDIAADLPGMSDGSLAWGDYDRDGDLDLALAGDRRAAVYANRGALASTAPSAPANVAARGGMGSMAVWWDAATDAETPSAGLSYNLRVVTDPGKTAVYPSMAGATGVSRLAAMGPVRHHAVATPYALALPAGDYEVSVQAVDAAYMGGAWSAPVKVTVTAP